MECQHDKSKAYPYRIVDIDDDGQIVGFGLTECAAWCNATLNLSDILFSLQESMTAALKESKENKRTTIQVYRREL